jgi:YihY family inner membrane protein
VVSLKTDIRDAALELLRDARPVGRYLLQSEAHVYAFSIAANVLLAFYPFLLVMLALLKHVFGWESAIEAVYVAVKDYFPGETGRFLSYNLGVSLGSHRRLEWVSVLVLLFTANGVFLPLEVALNRAWGVKEHRSLLRNQALSMSLIFVCGALALLSAALTGAAQALWDLVASAPGQAPGVLAKTVFKVASIPLTILILFLVYWWLPNTKVPARLVLPRAVVIGLLLEAMKWVSLAVWPWLYAKFRREYGPFVNSVTILTWSFLAALIVLAGADWSARRARRVVEESAAGGPHPVD